MIKKYDSLAGALVDLFGNSVKIAKTDRLTGGDINKAYGLTLTDGTKVFMKANAKENFNFFECERAGLEEIQKTGAISTPKVLGYGTDNGEQVGYSFLLLSFVELGNFAVNFWDDFAQSLAKMHRYCPAEGSNGFGFYQDNYIGARAQKNTWTKSWIEFFRDNRLAVQFKDADKFFDESDRKRISKLLDNLDKFLIEPDAPSLLHGDMWAGNVMCGPEGKAVLIDPASYYGHREADLAMTELFGGFNSRFYEAYNEAFPLESGYEDRRDLYNLYHLLNHLNMFGQNYLDGVRAILREYAG